MSRRAPLLVTCLILAPTFFAAACTQAPPPPNEVRVAGLDYAFEAPDTLPPGPTVFHFENRGEVEHEMILVRLREGVTLDDVLEGAREGAESSEFVEGGLGILVVDAGEAAANQIFVDLVPGRDYALLCFLQDSPDDPPHIRLGMRASFHVSDGAS